MQKVIIFFLLLPAIFSCKTIKTVKTLRKGEVGQQEFTASFPFEYRLGLIVLKVNLEGKTYDFILDTGAPNVISKELAAELKIKPVVSDDAVDSEGEKSELGFAQIPDLSLGGIHFLNTGAAIADLKRSTEIACLKIDGFIGANLMRKAIWQIDYEKQIITITHSKSNLDIPAGSKTMPFKTKVTGTPMVDVNYNGVTDRNVTFDLGSNGNLGSSNDVLKKANEKRKLKTIYGSGNNVSGLFGQSSNDTTQYAIVPSVKIGDLELQNEVVSFTKNKGRLMGTKIFNHFRVIIDWEEEEITMIPVKEYNNSNLKTFGMSPVFRDNKLFVGFIFQGSSAEKAGINIGEQILEINGQRFRECSIEQWCDILENGYFPENSETNTILVLKNGEEKRYNLTKTTILE